MHPPSIFNDVIGPVMRGPSSSHSAASVRIGLLARALMDNEIDEILVEFDETSALAATHDSHGSDMGLCAGLLGFDLSDERLRRFEHEMQTSGMQIHFKTGNYGDVHPNTYRLHLKNQKEEHSLTAISTGGGSIEVITIDGNSVSLFGDSYATLVYFNGDPMPLVGIIKKEVLKGMVSVKHAGDRCFVLIESHLLLNTQCLEAIQKRDGVYAVKQLLPVLPIHRPQNLEVPFLSCSDMLEFNRNRNLSLGELAILYESGRGGISTDQVHQKMMDTITIIRKSIQHGLNGTEFNDRILGCQSTAFMENLQDGKLMDMGIMNQAILYVTALMEVKSSMGVFVAAPTGGSCGGLPGVIFAAADAMSCDDTQIARALMAAGLIGVFIVKSATLAGEIGGCQAECGAGSGMAAAALVDLMGGKPEKAVSAASMALQNILGMVCDPVANRVEVPCLGKNVMAASNAVSCANMALAGFDPVIPLDEVVIAMDFVGRNIPHELKCTALGGLSVTPTSKQIEVQLRAKGHK